MWNCAILRWFSQLVQDRPRRPLGIPHLLQTRKARATPILAPKVRLIVLIVGVNILLRLFRQGVRSTKKLKSLESSEAKLKKDSDAKIAAANQKIKDLEGTISQLSGEDKDLKLEVEAAKKQNEDAETTARTCA